MLMCYYLLENVHPHPNKPTSSNFSTIDNKPIRQAPVDRGISHLQKVKTLPETDSSHMQNLAPSGKETIFLPTSIMFVNYFQLLRKKIRYGMQHLFGASPVKIASPVNFGSEKNPRTLPPRLRRLT